MTIEEHKYRIKKLKEICIYIEQLTSDVKDWTIVYDLVFGLYHKMIKPILEDLGLEFSYADSDSTYEVDTMVFVNAFKEFCDDLPN